MANTKSMKSVLHAYYYYYLALFFFCSLLNASDGACNPSDKAVLLKIKDHFNNSAGFSAWDPNTDCCGWGGGGVNLGCGSDNDPNVTDRVTLFMVTGVKFSGVIPSEIGDLPFLEILSLDEMPDLTGPIPASIGKLTRLAELSITSTGVSGPIPHSLASLTNLIKLYLDFNNLSGTIPSYLALLPNLSELMLSRNNLTGGVPESFGSFKDKFELDLSSNQLSGPIPRSLGQANISRLSMYNNSLEGDASFLLGKDKPLEEILMFKNKLEFNFSNVEPPMGLTSLDMSHNNIYGSLPKQFGQLRQLVHFNMGYNQLCGKVPKGRRFKHFGVRAGGFDHNKCLCDAPGLPACNITSNFNY